MGSRSGSGSRARSNSRSGSRSRSGSQGTSGDMQLFAPDVQTTAAGSPAMGESSRLEAHDTSTTWDDSSTTSPSLTTSCNKRKTRAADSRTFVFESSRRFHRLRATGWQRLHYRCRLPHDVDKPGPSCVKTSTMAADLHASWGEANDVVYGLRPRRFLFPAPPRVVAHQPPDLNASHPRARPSDTKKAAEAYDGTPHKADAGSAPVSRVDGMRSVARAGIEPATRGFSIRCSTN